MWRAGFKRGGWEGLESFRVVSACAVLMEVERLEKVFVDNDREFRYDYGYGDEIVGNEVTAVDVGARDESRTQGVPEQRIADGEEGNLFDLEMLLRALGR
jgi:hypothetical protein